MRVNSLNSARRFAAMKTRSKSCKTARFKTHACVSKERAARVVALSAAVPCMAREAAYKSGKEKKNLKKYAKNLGMDAGEIPSFIDCGIVRLLAESSGE